MQTKFESIELLYWLGNTIVVVALGAMGVLL